MAKTETVHTRVTPEIKMEADRVFESMGLTTSQAIMLFLTATVNKHKFPFELSAPSKEDEDLSALKKKDNHKISANDVVFSEAGYKKAKMELYILKTWKLAKCEEQIGIARSYGDLSENAEYDAAKEEQTKIARRIDEIENNLKRAVITDNIVVVIKEVGSDEEETYEICGTTEANPEENKISNQSPLAKALAGKKAGDIIEYEAPGGTFKFEVIRKDK